MSVHASGHCLRNLTRIILVRWSERSCTRNESESSDDPSAVWHNSLSAGPGLSPELERSRRYAAHAGSIGTERNQPANEVFYSGCLATKRRAGNFNDRGHAD